MTETKNKFEFVVTLFNAMNIDNLYIIGEAYTWLFKKGLYVNLDYDYVWYNNSQGKTFSFADKDVAIEFALVFSEYII